MDEERKTEGNPPQGDGPRREISYHVGWSRGKISSSSSSSSSSSTKAAASEPKSHAPNARNGQFSYKGIQRDRENFAERIVWRSLPGLPGRWVTVLLWTAPVMSFAATYALVLALTRNP